ncbi:MAG: AzlC family ABC transporter permease [Syntrophobacteraceae bacterium]|jgi:4-azaleucine resistance transporter AzlC
MGDTRKSASFIKEGAKAAWPICIGYFPLGLAFGILAQKGGLSLPEIALMSLIVFAGSSQFIAVSMLNSGAAPVSIILTTFMVNLRHVLMSSSLALYLRGSSRKFLIPYAYGVTDESFAVNLTRFRDTDWHPYEALTVNQVANAAWIGSTILGGYGGQFIPAGYLGIDYALSAMFLCLLVFQLRGRIYVLTAILSGCLAISLSLLIPGNAYGVLASFIGATGGFALLKAARRKQFTYGQE